MSFSYVNTLTADRDRLRFLVDDRLSTDFIFQDEELDGVLSLEANVFLAAAICVYQRTVLLAEKAIRYRLSSGIRSGVEIDRTKVAAEMRLTAKYWVEKAFSIPEEAWDRVVYDIDRYGRDLSDYQGIQTDDQLGDEIIGLGYFTR